MVKVLKDDIILFFITMGLMLDKVSFSEYQSYTSYFLQTDTHPFINIDMFLPET